MYSRTPEMKLFNFVRIITVVSTILEGSCIQLRALSLQILLFYQMFQPITLTNVITVVHILTYQHLRPNSRKHIIAVTTAVGAPLHAQSYQ